MYCLQRLGEVLTVQRQRGTGRAQPPTNTGTQKTRNECRHRCGKIKKKDTVTLEPAHETPRRGFEITTNTPRR